MISFKEFLNENGIDYFIVEIPENLLNDLVDINEGQWKNSRKNGYKYRIDAENPSLKQQRHVHIAKSKHTNSKNKQVSWNQDGSKHDKKSFNSNIASLKAVQSIARDVLGLTATVKLEEALKARKLISIVESMNNDGPVPVWFRAVQV